MLSFLSNNRLFATALGSKVLLSLLLLAAIFAHVYWLAPITPTASLTLADKCSLLAISADNKTLITTGKGLSGRSHGPIRVWDVEQGIERFSVAEDWPNIGRIVLSPDNRILAAQEYEGDLKMWDVCAGKELANVRTGELFETFCFSSDGALLAVRKNHELITFLDTNTQQEKGKIEGDYWTMAFAADSKSVATATRIDGQNGKRVRQWRIGLDELPVLIRDFRIRANKIAFAPDLKTIVTLNYRNGRKPAEIALWDMTGKKLCSFGYQEVENSVRIAFAGNGKILTVQCFRGGRDLRTTFYDLTANPKEIACFNDVKPCVSSNGIWLAMAKENGAELMKLGAAKTPADPCKPGNTNGNTLKLPVGGIHFDFKTDPPITFSPDCKTLAVGPLYYSKPGGSLRGWLPQWIEPFLGDPYGSIFRLWDVTRGEELFAFNGCSQLVFSPDGKILATSHLDKTVKLWRLPLCKPMARIFALTIAFWLFAMAVWLDLTAMQRRRDSR